VEFDPKQEVYKEIYGKTLMFMRLIGGIAIYTGGFLSDLVGREGVFGLQALLSLVIALLFFVGIKQIEDSTKQMSVSEYNARLIAGIKLVFQSRTIFFFALTYIIIFTVNSIWTGLIVFPVYFGYTGSDSLASLLRGTLFVLGSLITGLSTRVSKKLDERRQFWRFFLVQAVVVYGSYTILLWKFPISTSQDLAEFNLLALVFVFIIASSANFFSGILLIMAQKIMLSIVPDQNRNSFYSLMPTLTLILSSGYVVLTGNFISLTQNFSLTVLIFIIIPVLLCACTSFLSMHYMDQNELDPEQG
jgi:Na+/melibiose symporter-like transporter